MGSSLRSRVSARCSIAAGRPPSPRLNGSAVESLRSASGPESRCRIIQRANRICGVDISEAMLMKAQERVSELKMTHVEGLWVMDAEHLTFPDASFDVVVAHT